MSVNFPVQNMAGHNPLAKTAETFIGVGKKSIGNSKLEFPWKGMFENIDFAHKGLTKSLKDTRWGQLGEKIQSKTPFRLNQIQPQNNSTFIVPQASKGPQQITHPHAPQAPEIANSMPALASESRPGTVAGLMDRFTQAWDSDIQNFNFEDPFDLDHFAKLLENHAQKFTKEGVNDEEHYGYIEKFDLDPAQNPQIYMRADLHGDLKSLIENIRSLQEQGLLDESFKCKEGVHLVFLGDYCDRGEHGTQVLEMLMHLREENPEQVHLIRGNHEYQATNQVYGNTDKNLMQTVKSETGRQLLERFYETMPLTSYFSVDGESREYMQCTHGLFELTMDPAALLDEGKSGDFMAVSKKRELSERIRKIAEGNSELSAQAKRIMALVKDSTLLESDLTAYNWGDVTEDETSLGRLGYRDYALNAHDIRACLDLSSQQHRVVMLFRGHQHQFQHLKIEDEVVVTTLPVGMDCPAYKDRFDQPDLAYIIKPKGKVADWEKRAILRESGNTVTDAVTEAYPLISSEI